MFAAVKKGIVTFGTFEVNLESGEIRKAGRRIKLQGQPFRVLTALLSRPGEVVSREDLQHEIWGDNTTIDFERGIASAVNKIRDALGDSADNPRYVETLAKRGYRFIAPVAFEDAPEHLPSTRIVGPPLTVADVVTDVAAKATKTSGAPVLPSAMAVPLAEPSRLPSAGTGAGQAPKTHASGRTISLAVVAAVLLVALTFLGSSWLLRSRSASSPPRVQQIRTANVLYSGPPNNENPQRLATDGVRIYASFLINGRSRLSSVSLDGTEVQPIHLPDELGTVSITDISRDGSRLIVRTQNSRDAEQPLWVVPTTGESALRVGEVLAHDATWMPRGNSILFASGNRLGTVNLDTGAESTYTDLPGRAFWPRWSPDGTKLSLTLMDPVIHSTSLWQIDAATRHLQRLTFPGMKDEPLCCGSWMADGSYVYEASPLGESDIWMVGKGKHPSSSQLTNGPLRFVSPLPGRNDPTLYFLGMEQPANDQRYDTRSSQFLPAPAYLRDAGRVMYSRDGLWVAWTDASGHLWRARSADGSDRLRLTEDDLEVFLAQWSPDGQQLVLMAHRPGETWRIYTIAASGGAVHLLLADRRNLADPDWSADGRSIVFGRQAELMGKENGPNELQILDLAGHTVRSLPGSENLFSPRWSPDGRYILALSLDQTRIELYDTTAGAWRTLFTGSAADPVWSADSKSIFFHASEEPHAGIMRVPVNGKPAQMIVDLQKNGYPSDNSRFSGVTPTGDPIIQPGIGSANLYSIRLHSN